MSTTTLTVTPKGQDQHLGLRIFVFSCLLPGAAYFVIMLLAVFGILSPARWLVGMLSGTWAVPLLWCVVIGGPILSVIGSLILNTRRLLGRRLDGICGGVAAVLLILNLLLSVPFPFILAIE